MESALTNLNALGMTLKTRLREIHEDQDGYSSEAVIVTSLLVALAVAAVAIIAAKVLSTANGIQTQ